MTPVKEIPLEVKNKVWDILVKEAGAYGDEHGYERQGFVSKWPCSEFRFQGLLGFGGKIWHHNYMGNGHEVYVNCYAEDETPEKREIMQKVNTMLRDLFKAEGLYFGK